MIVPTGGSSGFRRRRLSDVVVFAIELQQAGDVALRGRTTVMAPAPDAEVRA